MKTEVRRAMAHGVDGFTVDVLSGADFPGTGFKCSIKQHLL